MTAQITPQAGVFHIAGVLTFATVDDLLKRSLALINAVPAPQFDLSAVSHMDSAGLALLCEWKRRYRQAQFHHLPEQIIGMVKLSGIESVLYDAQQ